MGASKIYGTGETAVRALDEISVEFAQSAYTAIMGPSGSGKSTLLHCLAGLDTLTSGHVFLGDLDMSSLPEKELTKVRRDRIGFIFQSYNLSPTLDAEENITLPMALGGRKPDQVADHVIDIVDFAAASSTAVELSGGQQRRGRSTRSPAPRCDLRRRAHGNLDTRRAPESSISWCNVVDSTTRRS